MARWTEIANQLAAEIAAGDFGVPGDRFLSVRGLAARFGISPVSAHRVIAELKRWGHLQADSTNRPRLSAIPGPAGGGGPQRLGMVVTNLASPFFSDLCRRAQQAATGRGYQLLVAGSDYDPERERRLVHDFLEIGVSGLLVVPGVDPRTVGLYAETLQRAPLVFVSRRLEELSADFVVADSFVGGAAVAGHFLSRGYDSCAYIGFGSTLARDPRLRGFRSALAEEGAALAETRIVFGEGGTAARGYAAMERLMALAPRPRAVFAFSDLLALGALRYCQQAGIDVPGDVALAGFDNLPQSQATSPPLTSVAYPVEAMARLAVGCLLDRIERTPPAAARILLEPRLVVRGSTDPAAPAEAAGESPERHDVLGLH